MERRAKGRELQFEGSGAEAIEPTFADGDEVRIIAVLFYSMEECVDAAFGEMPGMEFDAIVLTFVERLVVIGFYDDTHPLGWNREDGSWTAGSVGVYVGKGEHEGEGVRG